MLDEHYPNRVQLLSLGGTAFYVTPDAWQFPLKVAALGFAAALVFNRGSGVTSVVILGSIYTVLMLLSYLLHTVGHIISAREVDAPMQASVLTRNRQYNIYPPGSHPPQVHLGRAIGGPLMNLTLAAVVFIVWAVIPGWGFLVFALTNLILGLVALVPAWGMDGEVLWRGKF